MALDDGRVVSNFVSQALTGQPLTVYGDGQQTRSFQVCVGVGVFGGGWLCRCSPSWQQAIKQGDCACCPPPPPYTQFISDLVKGIVAVMDGPYIGPFNVGNPDEFTMLELAQLVKEVVAPDATIEFRENTADDPSKRK
jgi:UDP-glucuronate decarboxylase